MAVVDGRLKDIWDSREMGDRTKYRRDDTLVGLWIRCDEQSTVDAAKEIIDRYAEVRCYDDAPHLRKTTPRSNRTEMKKKKINWATT